MNITAPALRRLQVLYGQYERHSLDAPGSSREQRLAWATSQVRRQITSFKDLSTDEGRKLIDTLQGLMNVKAPSKTPRKRMQRDAARKAGTEGRRDGDPSTEVTMASANDFARIQQQLTRLGWNQAGLDRFLLGSRSPIKGRTVIRTLGEANKVYWALKHIPARDVFHAERPERYEVL